MGANQSNPLVPPPLSDATDDSDDEHLSSEEILTKLVEKGGGEDDLSDLIDRGDCKNLSSMKFEDGMVGEGISPPKLR